jgi:hypothetical protein
MDQHMPTRSHYTPDKKREGQA